MTEKTMFRMSSCGYCPRRLGYRRLGYEALPVPPWLATSAEEGHWHEERIIGELKQGRIDMPGYGLIPWFTDARQKEYELEYPTFVLRGHIEGIVSTHPFIRQDLLEIKSMSPFEFDRWSRGRWLEFPAYADQLTVYMEATKLNEALYIVKNRSTGYKDRQVVTEQPSSISKIIDKLDEVELRALVNELVPMEFDPNNWECKWCEYRQHCMPPLPVLAKDQEKELIAMVAKWRKGDALESEGSKLKEAAKIVLRGYAELTPTQRLVFHQLAISIYAVHTVKYPKNEVEKLLAPDVLENIAKVTDRQDCRVDDLAKKEVRQ